MGTGTFAAVVEGICVGWLGSSAASPQRATVDWPSPTRACSPRPPAPCLPVWAASRRWFSRTARARALTTRRASSRPPRIHTRRTNTATGEGIEHDRSQGGLEGRPSSEDKRWRWECMGTTLARGSLSPFQGAPGWEKDPCPGAACVAARRPWAGTFDRFAVRSCDGRAQHRKAVVSTPQALYVIARGQRSGAAAQRHPGCRMPSGSRYPEGVLQRVSDVWALTWNRVAVPVTVGFRLCRTTRRERGSFQECARRGDVG
jgi:hypothetical protein